MSKQEEFASTMRIDITPEVLRELGGNNTNKHDTQWMRKQSPVVNIPRGTVQNTGETKYDQLLQSLYDAALVTTLDGQVLDANARALEFFRYSGQELKKLSMMDLVAGASKDLLKTLRQTVQGERFALIQAYCMRKDNSLFPAEIAVNLLRFSEMQMCFFVRDITLRKQAEEMLRTEHNAIQNAGNGIAIADIEGMIEYLNPAAVKLWGCRDPEELTGRNVWDLFEDDEAAKEMVRRVLNDQDWSGEGQAKRRDGGSLAIQVEATGNRDAEGDLTGMVFSFTDLSDRKRAEEATRQAEQQRVMLASLGAACHHLGQPATVLMTNLELMQRRLAELGDDYKSIIESCMESAEQIGDLLHQMNMVDEFRTTLYIEDRNDPDSPTNRILDIGNDKF
jgi:PAS domain S-box-containing protein